MAAFSIGPTDLGSGWFYSDPYWRTDTTATHTFSNVSNLPAEAESILDATSYAQFADAFSAINVGCYHSQSFGQCPGHANINPGSFAAYTDTLSGMTVATLNAATLGYYGPVTVISRVWAQSSQVYGNYVSASPAGFMYLLSLVTPLIGVGLTLAEMPRLNAEIRRRPYAPGGYAWLNPDKVPGEYEAALESWKAYRHPVYSIPATWQWRG